jgi:hypothetical protein
MSQNVRKILGFVGIGLILLLFGTRGCSSKEEAEKVEKMTTTTTSSPDPAIELLQQKIADLQKQLSEARPTGSPAPSAQQPGPSVVVVDSAVDAMRQYQRNRVRDAKIASERKIAEAEEAEEKKIILKDRIEFLRDKISRLQTSLSNLENITRNSDTKDPAVKSDRKRMIHETEEEIRQTKNDLLKAQEEL